MPRIYCESCENECTERYKTDEGFWLCQTCFDTLESTRVLDVSMPETVVWMSTPAKMGKYPNGTQRKIFMVPQKLTDFIDINKKYSIIVRGVK